MKGEKYVAATMEGLSQVAPGVCLPGRVYLGPGCGNTRIQATDTLLSEPLGGLEPEATTQH